MSRYGLSRAGLEEDEALERPKSQWDKPRVGGLDVQKLGCPNQFL
jgi:hypothetical protein